MGRKNKRDTTLSKPLDCDALMRELSANNNRLKKRRNKPSTKFRNNYNIGNFKDAK